MMCILKPLLMAITGLAITLGMTGCAIKSEMSILYGKEQLIKEDTVGKLIIVEGAEKWRSPSDGYNKSTRNMHVLQNAADATINEGYKYFAFARPHELSAIYTSVMIYDLKSMRSMNNE